MGTELAGNTVEIVVGALVSVQLTGLILIGAVQFPHPGTLDDLNRIRQHLGSFLAGFFLQQALLQLEITLGHLFRGLIAGPGQLHRFLEGRRLIVDEVEGALTGAENILCRIGGIAAAQKHGVVILACHVVGLYQGIGAQIGGAILTKGADYYGRHREKQRGLIEIVHDAKILKTTHNGLLLYCYYNNFRRTGEKRPKSSPAIVQERRDSATNSARNFSSSAVSRRQIGRITSASWVRSS